jgi:hypothetical protein
VKVERPLPLDGQSARITELWAWTAIDPLTDTEGIIAARLPGLGVTPMVTSMRTTAEVMESVAREAVRGAEHPKPTVQLRHFIEAPE